VVAVGVAALCVRLGFWQLSRLDDRRASNARIAAGLAEPIVAFEALPDAADEAAYRRVTATGTYLAGDELLLYGRPLDGRPGDHVLTPLRLDDDAGILLVDRGWVPFGADRTVPVPGAEPPTGAVTIEGVVLPSEDAAAFPEGADTGTVHAVELDAIAAATGLDLEPVYLLLRSQMPGSTNDLPVPTDLPPRDEGPHLSYAIQWFSFAAIALLGYGLLMRRDRRSSAGRSEEEATH
jgi:surfeit locus 1 family protein